MGPRMSNTRVYLTLAIAVAMRISVFAQQDAAVEAGDWLVQKESVRASVPNFSTVRLMPAQVQSSGPIVYSITFVDPGAVNAAYYSGLTENIKAAGAFWAGFLSGGGNIEVEVEFTNAIAGVDGASYSNGYVHTTGARSVYEQGAAYEIRTGTDPNGATADVHIRINPTYLANTLWLDPHPLDRTDPIPANHLDGVSIFIHELGHAFAFTGWINGTTGALPASYMSTFDERVQFDGSNFFFTGPLAQADYGSPVPITYGNQGHLGNNTPRPGSDLLTDLMNGVVYYYQTRYIISHLDRAIVKDCGVDIALELPTIRVSSLTKSSGHFVVQGGGIPSRLHRIKATTNLAQPFAAIGSATTDSAGNLQFDDTAASSYSARFYRVVYP